MPYQTGIGFQLTWGSYRNLLELLSAKTRRRQEKKQLWVIIKHALTWVTSKVVVFFYFLASQVFLFDNMCICYEIQAGLQSVNCGMFIKRVIWIYTNSNSIPSYHITRKQLNPWDNLEEKFENYDQFQSKLKLCCYGDNKTYMWSECIVTLITPSYKERWTN